MKTTLPCYQPKQILLVIFLLLICFIGFRNECSAQVNHLVISQVYGGGGGSGATYKSDFVELFNPTSSVVFLSNYTVQYQSPGNGASWTSTGALSGSIVPGRYYLIQLNPNGTGNPFPTPDFIPMSTINLSTAGGKIALVNSTTALTSCSSGFIVDKVGYGTTSEQCNETANAAKLNNTTSIFRADNGYTDTDDNSADFSTGTPNARNSSNFHGATVTTGAVTSTSANGAMLNGFINAHGSPTTVSFFKYGLATSYGSTVNASPSTVSGYTATAVTAAVSGLAANTLYHYLLTATNSIGTSNGSDATFTTLPNAPVTGTASAIKTTGFTANWLAPTSGGPETFTYTVEVSANTSFSPITTSSSNISSTNPSSVITGLVSATTYYYRVKAVNATGSSVYSATSAAVTTSIRVPATLTVTTQPVGPNANGGILTTQPQVTVKDQDGATLPNIVVNAAVTNGQTTSWTLGGTTSVTTDKNGVAKFTNLSATNNTATAFSATLTFTPATGSGSAVSGNFTIPPPPANDECVNAVALTINNSTTCNTLTSGTTVGATQSMPSSTGTADDDVWYSFTATSSAHAITIEPAASGGISNPVFQTFSGSCAGLKDSGYTTNNVRNFKGLTIGSTYYIRVFSNANGSGQGAFTICITTPVSSANITSSGQVAAGAINVNSTANLISRFSLTAANVANTITSIAIPFTGTYTSADITNLRLFYNTASSLTGATQFGNTFTSTSSGSGETKTFTGTASLPISANPYYFFILTDITAGALPGRTINVGGLFPGNFTFQNANTVTTGSASASGTQTITTTPPALTAAVNATVDNPFIISFSENVNFRNNITAVSFDGNVLPAAAYDKTAAGQITFKPAQSPYLQTAKTANITITSTGYTTATISQVLKAGVATHLTIIVQPASPAINGYALLTQPTVKIADKYENAANSTATITADATQPVWMLGGTQNKAAVSGIAAYSNLTASSAAALSGATITFSCPGFASVVSNPFAIPGISPIAGEIVINQLNPGYSAASDEYIELVNTTDKTFDLNTLSIKYASASGGGGVDKPLSGTLLPHSFWLLSSNATVTVGATKNVTSDGTFLSGLDANACQVSLQWKSNSLVVIDAVGYGKLTGGSYYEIASAASPANKGGLKRNFDGFDNNNNSTDFVLVDSANINVRNSSSRLANAGAIIAAGTYADVSVTGISDMAGNVTVTNKITSLPIGQFGIGSNTLILNGTMTGGTLTGSATSDLVTGSSTAISFTTGGNTLHNLTVTSGTLTLGSNVNITAGSNPGIIKIANGASLATNNHLTLKSDSVGTAAIGANTSGLNYITGNVTAERYIPITPINGVTGRTGRAWRLITSPVNQTIQNAWQEGKIWQGGTTEATAGLGTLITGEGDLNHMSSSFDFIPASAHHTSIKQYTPGAISGTWNVLPGNATTGTNIAVRSQPAWMLFVRGDRTANTSTAKSATTLRATGALTQGTQTTPVPGAFFYTLAGNPFASAIDFEQIFYASAGIKNQFTIWNSKLGSYGAYVLVRKTGANYTTVPYPFTNTPQTDNTARFIQSGEGFFVQPATSGVSGTLTIGESAKASVASPGGINPYREGDEETEGRLWVNLLLRNSDSSDTASALADGILVRFAPGYASGIDGDDTRKQANFNENLSVTNNENSNDNLSDLMVEARSEVAQKDTVLLHLWNLSTRSYALQVKTEQFASSDGLHAWLEDNYLKTKLELNLHGDISTNNFAITSDSASRATNRFRIVFENKIIGVLPLTLTNIKATVQPGGLAVAVSWTVTNEENIKNFVVERSANGGRTFMAIGNQLVAGGALQHYTFVDVAPETGENLYRIRIEEKNEKISYSAIVKAVIESGIGTQITLYPNPVSRTHQGGKASLVLKGIADGSYFLSVYSHGGQQVYQRKIKVFAVSAAQTEEVQLGSLAAGTYDVRFTNSKGHVFYKQQIVLTE